LLIASVVVFDRLLLLCTRKDQSGEFLERSVPTPAVVLARLLRRQAAVLEHDRRPLAVAAELDGHEADVSRRRAAAALPAPRVDEPARSLDLAVLAADDVRLAAVVEHPQRVAAADAQVYVATG
jgi:hypothetical protein